MSERYVGKIPKKGYAGIRLGCPQRNMIDQFNRDISYLRVSVTDLCNLRCTYCMPQDGVRKLQHRDILSYEEITEIVSAAGELGFKKIRVTGGEPLVRPGVAGLCRQISNIPEIEELCVTTNGILLEEYAQPLKDAGVRRVNISIDSLDPEKYKKITRGGDLQLVQKGIDAAQAQGMAVKLNTVLIGGFNEDEIEKLAALTLTRDIDVRFIELMPMSLEYGFDKSAFLSGEAVLERLPQLEPLDSGPDVARLYRLPKGMGRVGIISPISQHFCGQCNRLRLTAEGRLKPCLHSNQEINVRGLHEEALREAICEAVRSKPKMHGELSAQIGSEAGRAMNTIGG